MVVSSGKINQVREIRSKMDEVWPELLSDVSTDPDFGEIPSAVTWLKKVMEFNVPGGKKNRAIFSISLFNEIVTDETEREEALRLNLIFGWGTEIAAALMADDIMDDSVTRRGKTCWYREKTVGLPTAINDSLMLENVGYMILYKYFEGKDYFPALLRHTHRMVMQTIMGQSLDLRTSTEFSLDSCTPELYNQIVTYKTSYYTFYNPAASALIMARVKDQAIHDAVMKVTLRIGFLFQVQDDYLDCFGDPRVTGKVGTDIQDAKCTWLIVQAVQLASPAQRKILESHYGTHCENASNRIKEVYRELELEDAFREFEKKAYREISDMIAKMPKSLPKQAFYGILDSVYQREK